MKNSFAFLSSVAFFWAFLLLCIPTRLQPLYGSCPATRVSYGTTCISSLDELLASDFDLITWRILNLSLKGQVENRSLMSSSWKFFNSSYVIPFSDIKKICIEILVYWYFNFTLNENFKIIWPFLNNINHNFERNQNCRISFTCTTKFKNNWSSICFRYDRYCRGNPSSNGICVFTFIFGCLPVAQVSIRI